MSTHPRTEIEAKVEQKTLEIMKANKENIFLDLSKLSEEQIKSLPQILKNAGESIFGSTQIDLENGDIDRGNILEFYLGEWINSNFNEPTATNELTYPEFIKLFEGGKTSAESDENGSPLTYWGGKETSKEVLQVEQIDYEKKFNELKALVQSDSVYWCLRQGVKYPSDFDFEDNGYLELYNWVRDSKNN